MYVGWLIMAVNRKIDQWPSQLAHRREYKYLRWHTPHMILIHAYILYFKWWVEYLRAKPPELDSILYFIVFSQFKFQILNFDSFALTCSNSLLVGVSNKERIKIRREKKGDFSRTATNRKAFKLHFTNV